LPVVYPGRRSLLIEILSSSGVFFFLGILIFRAGRVFLIVAH